MVMVPYKSVAAALVLAVLLGPLGVFYSSFLGGIVMSIFGLVSIGTMESMHSYLPLATVCLLGIVWAMAAVRFYNYKMLKIAINESLNTPPKSSEEKFPKSGSFLYKRKVKAVIPVEEVTADTIETEDQPSSWKL